MELIAEPYIIQMACAMEINSVCKNPLSLTMQGKETFIYCSQTWLVYKAAPTSAVGLF